MAEPAGWRRDSTRIAAENRSTERDSVAASCLRSHIGTNTTLTSVAKSIAIEIKLRKYTISQIQSEDFIAARLDMRNKP